MNGFFSLSPSFFCFLSLLLLLLLLLLLVHCELDGITCNNAGSCGPTSIGCVCNSRDDFGEFCTFRNYSDQSSGLTKVEQSSLLITISGIIIVLMSWSY